MRLTEKHGFNANLLADISSEVMEEIDNDEPACFAELREASKLEFRYEILNEIDHGGMKSVHRAIDTRTRRDVAIAFIKSDGLSKKALRYFIQEAWITASLEHPNIVPIHDVGISPDGSPYFVMKLLTGETLRPILKKLSENNKEYSAKFTERSLLDIFVKICDAISYAHECGVVHLDLKPDNIQISDFGQVLVIDWGISNVLNSYESESHQKRSSPDTLKDLDQTLFGAIRGTPGYIAPELLKKSSKMPDYKADIYGLGAILYSLLTFNRPKQITTDSNILEEQSSTEMPQALQSIINRAMKIEPEDRYSSVNGLKIDVESYLAGHATQAEEASFLRHQILLVKRNLRMFITIAVALLLLLVVSGFFMLSLTISEKKAIDNEQRALHQEKIISEREAHAQQLLRQYEAEKKIREKREKTSVEYYIVKALDAFSKCDTKQALADIEVARNLDPNEYRTKQIWVNILISLQQFNRVASNFPLEHDDQRYALALKYAKVKPDSRLLTNDELKHYFTDLNIHILMSHNRVLYNIFYTINKGRTFSSQRVLIEEAYRIITPGSHLYYSNEHDRVSIEGNSTQSVAMLAGLEFKGLDLSKTKINNAYILWAFKNLEYLNVKNTSLAFLQSISVLKKLRYLDLENTLITSLSSRDTTFKLNYLSLAKTSLLTYPSGGFNVEILNIIHAHKLDLMSIVQSGKAPKKILLTPAQLEHNPKFVQSCKKHHIKLITFASPNEVTDEMVDKLLQ